MGGESVIGRLLGFLPLFIIHHHQFFHHLTRVKERGKFEFELWRIQGGDERGVITYMGPFFNGRSKAGGILKFSELNSRECQSYFKGLAV